MSDPYLRQSIREVAKIYAASENYLIQQIGDALLSIADRADAKDEAHERLHEKIINEIGEF